MFIANQDHVTFQSCDVKCLDLVVREPAIGLIKWLRPKGLKVFSYVEKFAEFKNQICKIKIVKYKAKVSFY